MGKKKKSQNLYDKPVTTQFCKHFLLIPLAFLLCALICLFLPVDATAQWILFGG